MKFLFFLVVFWAAVSSTAVRADSLPEACQQACVSTFGKVVGVSSGGIEAFSNCSSHCVNPEPNFLNGVFTGIKWQCVEYARRWLLANYGVVYGDVDIAADIWNLDYVHTPNKEKQYEFKSVLNGELGAELKRGDLLIYAKAFLDTGHVAVVLDVDADKQTIIVGEQNYHNLEWQAESAREISYLQRDEELWLLDAYIIGWKRVVN